MSKDGIEEPKDVTSNEEKELRRVYDYLANYAPKAALLADLKPKIDRKAKLVMAKKNPDAVKALDAEGREMTTAAIDAELVSLNAECDRVQVQVDEIAADPLRKKEIEDMIWEVDENLDGCVDWEEFHLMFQRNIKDKTGLEPYQLFNVVQFMMYDRDNSGNVSVDETMHMLYARYGKDRLEEEMRALFGPDLKTQEGDGSLSFTEYLKARRRAGARAPAPASRRRAQAVSVNPRGPAAGKAAAAAKSRKGGSHK